MTRTENRKRIGGVEYIVCSHFREDARENAAIPLLQGQLAEKQKSIDNILNAIEQGVFTSSTKGRLEVLEAEVQDLQIKIAQEEIKRPRITREFIQFFFDKYRQMDLTVRESQQRLKTARSACKAL